jgi:aspartokinase/homoserine dehydrogenase 2
MSNKAVVEKMIGNAIQAFNTNENSVPLVVLGYGNIGRQFIKILQQNKSKIEQSTDKKIALIALANSQSFQLSQTCLLDQELCLTQPNQHGQLLDELAIYQDKPLVLIDLTASDWVAKQYLDLAQYGWHIISANKIAAANRAWALSIENKIKQNKRQWRKNTTVGAALPVQEAIKNLNASGDQINQVSGVFSGSLSWLFGYPVRMCIEKP